MKAWNNDDNENYWESSGRGLNWDDKKKYQFEDVKNFSVRSTKAVPVVSNTQNLKTYQNAEPLSYSIKAENDLHCPELLCYTCQKIITDLDSCKYEGNKVFTNEICWKHWIAKMTESENIAIDQLCSMASKVYCLERVSASCNGQLILKVVLALKGATREFEFGSLICFNAMAFDQYMSFLRETRQTDDKLLRFKYEVEEVMVKLHEIFTDNANVGHTTVANYIRTLNEFRDERLMTPKVALQSEMIREYLSLLEWQMFNNKEFINAPLIETVMENNVTYQAIKDSSKAKLLKDTFKFTPEEFVWTAIKSIYEEGKVGEIDNLFSNKIMGSKPDVSLQRIVAYLVYLNKEPDEVKMKCLSKISDLSELVDCANMYKLLNAYTEYLKRNKDNSQLKKIQQIVQNNRR